MSHEEYNLAVLTYHGLHISGHLTEAHDPFYSVAIEKFSSQMNWLHVHKYTAALASELRTISSQLLNARKAVCITFDDGLKSDFDLARPILDRYGLRATFFVVVDRIGTEGYMSWSQLEQVAAEGNSIQCHGLHHEDLTRVEEDVLLNDLQLARKTLSSRLGTRVNSLAVPFGCWNENVVTIAMRAGFELIFNSEERLACPMERALPRFAIHSRTTERHFRNVVNRRRLFLRATIIKRNSIEVTKRCLGNERYLALKRQLFS